MLFDFWLASPKKHTLYVYLRSSPSQQWRVAPGSHAFDLLARVLLHAGTVELLPFPIAAPVPRELLLGAVLLPFRVLDLVDELAMASARLQQLRAVGASRACSGSVDNAGADEDVDERLLVGVVRWSPLFRQVVFDPEHCNEFLEDP